MATSKTTINATGFNNMIRQLSKRTAASFDDVVDGIVAEVLTGAAMKTKTAKAKDVRMGVEKTLRRPFRTSSGAKIGRTKAGKVWYSDPGSTEFALIHSDSNSGTNIKQPAKVVPWGPITFSKGGRRLSPALLGRIKAAVRELNDFRKRDLAYRLSQVGLSKASWLQLLKILNLRPTSSRGLGKAGNVRFNSNQRSAVRGTRSNVSSSRYTVKIENRMRATLNRNAGGVRAFSRALNGKVKAFERAAEKDLKGYAKQFADRHGFKVR